MELAAARVPCNLCVSFNVVFWMRMTAFQTLHTANEE